MIDGLINCPERRGARIRRVMEVLPSDPIEEYLVERIPPEASPMKDPIWLYKDGVRVLLVDSVGVIIQGPFRYNGMPDVHVCFWDKILVGREKLCISIARRLADEAQAQGVFTAIPEESRVILAFARRLGFKEFGRTNDAINLSLITRCNQESTWASKQ